MPLTLIVPPEDTVLLSACPPDKIFCTPLPLIMASFAIPPFSIFCVPEVIWALESVPNTVWVLSLNIVFWEVPPWATVIVADVSLVPSAKPPDKTLKIPPSLTVALLLMPLTLIVPPEDTVLLSACPPDKIFCTPLPLIMASFAVPPFSIFCVPEVIWALESVPATVMVPPDRVMSCDRPSAWILSFPPSAITASYTPPKTLTVPPSETWERYE